MPAPERWLSVDPGESTGWALWSGSEKIDAGTTERVHFLDDLYGGLYQGLGPFEGVSLVVCEDWALYPWELPNLAWDKCRTARAIGAIELLCRLTGAQLVLQAAKIKEPALANAAEHLFDIPLHENRHQNDATLHGVFYLATQEHERPQVGEVRA